MFGKSVGPMGEVETQSSIMHINVLICFLNLRRFKCSIMSYFEFKGVESTPRHKIAERIWIWVTNGCNFISPSHLLLLSYVGMTGKQSFPKYY